MQAMLKTSCSQRQADDGAAMARTSVAMCFPFQASRWALLPQPISAPQEIGPAYIAASTQINRTLVQFSRNLRVLARENKLLLLNGE